MTNGENKLRVGYVVKMYPRLSETFIVNEILELERRGIEITIFSAKKPNEGKFHPQLSAVKADVYYLEDLDSKKWGTWFGKIWPGVALYKSNLWNLIEQALTDKDETRLSNILHAAWIGAKAGELRLDHLHAHFASLPSTLAYYTHLITGIPFSFTAHAKDIYVYGPDENFLDGKLSEAGFAVTVTKFNYNYIIDNIPGIKPGLLNVIYNGLDLTKYDFDHRPRENNLILGVGRLVPKKGFRTLLDACKILKDMDVSFRCMIVGSGSEEENLFEQCQELNLSDRVEFIGAKRHDEILELMQRATLLCLPCTVAEDGNQDALPTVLLEGLACGLPIISTDISGIPEIIDSEVDGILVEPDKPEILSNQLVRLLSSEELRIKFAKAGKEKAAERFDLRKNVESLIALFQKSGKSAANGR